MVSRVHQLILVWTKHITYNEHIRCPAMCLPHASFAGAHCTFGKDVPMKQMIEDMQVAYVRHVVRPKMLIEERNGSQLSFDSTDSVDTLRLRSRSYMLPGQVPPPEPEVDPQMVRTGSRCQSRTGGDSDPAGAFTDNILEDCESVQ